MSAFEIGINRIGHLQEIVLDLPWDHNGWTLVSIRETELRDIIIIWLYQGSHEQPMIRGSLTRIWPISHLVDMAYLPNILLCPHSADLISSWAQVTATLIIWMKIYRHRIDLDDQIKPPKTRSVRPRASIRCDCRHGLAAEQGSRCDFRGAEI